MAMSAPQVMGILNVTPDSFSDGGRHNAPDQALAHARVMVGQGAAIIDIGGESTRPGAAEVPVDEEIRRTAPVIEAIRADMPVPISIDTRKKPVAQAAIDAGADLVNDVAGFTFDPDLVPYCAAHDLPVCVMHAQGDPETMQQAPRYDDVLLDVYDFLEERLAALEAAGIPRSRILTDPGIGFGKKMEHNLPLLRRIGLFHSLGCPILLGVSMWLQQKLNPAPTDPAQQMIFAWMPWVFMFMLGSFASGLVLYWITNNTITFIQQYSIMRFHGYKPDVFGNIKSSFKRKKPEKE